MSTYHLNRVNLTLNPGTQVNLLCVQELQHVSIPVMLMPDDFRAFSKVKIDNHAFNKENLPSHFKIKEYCPLVFRNLRERFGLEDMEYLNSLTKSPKVCFSPNFRRC